MSDTYCGRSCSECGLKEKLSCAGCSSGPGAGGSDDCQIAKCCRKNDLTSCDGCIWNESCSTLRKKDTAPQERIERKKKAAAETRMERTYQMLAKRLCLLFWLVIVSNVVGLLSIDEIQVAVPSLRWPVVCILTLAEVLYALILLGSADAGHAYRYAGIAGLIAAALSLVEELFAGAGWIGLISVLACIPAFIKEFQEFIAHADAVERLDSFLAEKWRCLWLWKFSFMLVPVICLVLALFLPGLAAILTIGAMVGTLIVAVIEIVYLYKTSAVFREHHSDH